MLNLSLYKSLFSMSVVRPDSLSFDLKKQVKEKEKKIGKRRSNSN